MRACLSTALQVLNMFDYFYGLESIPDDMVVNELLGVPTYLLHGAWQAGGQGGVGEGGQEQERGSGPPDRLVVTADCLDCRTACQDAPLHLPMRSPCCV